jgi:hypothetical protein
MEEFQRVSHRSRRYQARDQLLIVDQIPSRRRFWAMADGFLKKS